MIHPNRTILAGAVAFVIAALALVALTLAARDGGVDAAGDASGNYDVLVTLVAGSPGEYIHCKADIQQDTLDLTTRLYCYKDIPGVDVNPEAYPGVSGDGIAGVPPPTPYGDIDDKHAQLLGVVDKVNDLVLLDGCFEDRDGQDPWGHVYWELSVDINTLAGSVDVWIDQVEADCTTGAAFGDYATGAGAPDYDDAEIALTLLAAKPNDYDSDGDGCADKTELQDPPGGAGDEAGPVINKNEAGISGVGGILRDPYNRWDLYDGNGDTAVSLPDDILGTILRYSANPSLPYDADYDRGPSLAGSHHWNRTGPDGVIDLPNDILGVILQYKHNCS